jgi:SAM-dependent methyltransferase
MISYDQIGIGYSQNRQTDPRIAEQLFAKVEGAERIINIGAGAGSYEPAGVNLVAVEPSQEMISQRKRGSHPVIQGMAEDLPFESNSFTHAMSVLSMHHWTNRKKAYTEINRVVTEKFVAITWNPAAEPFWLTRDYFPEFYEKDQQNFPSKDELALYFDQVIFDPLLIPHDCIDGFLAAFWKRPEAYFSEKVQQSISSFANFSNKEKGLAMLKSDLENGTWELKNKEILSRTSLDAGYVILSAKTRKSKQL